MNKRLEVKGVMLSEDCRQEAGGSDVLSVMSRERRQFVEPEVSDAIKVLKATQFFQQFSDNGNTGRPNG